MTRAWYNEHDPFPAAWLRNLARAGHIAAGEVDERDIRDVVPAELLGFTQCHFFAGVGVWSHALRLAGWPDDRFVWTASCPCQPFSAAGRGLGFADERHVWPALYHLVRECRPDVVLGEQVASADGLAWLDLVHADLEAAGYAVGAVDLCAAGIGAPHIRQRLFWVAYSRGARLEGVSGRALGVERPAAQRGGAAGGVGNSDSERPCQVGRFQGWESADREGGTGGWLADADSEARGCQTRKPVSGDRVGAVRGRPEESGRRRGDGLPGPVNGFWRGADWVLCRDPDGPRWRPVGPGLFPLAHGAPARVGRLRAYGNAIVAPVAAVFVGAVMEAIGS